MLCNRAHHTTSLAECRKAFRILSQDVICSHVGDVPFSQTDAAAGVHREHISDRPRPYNRSAMARFGNKGRSMYLSSPAKILLGRLVSSNIAA